MNRKELYKDKLQMDYFSESYIKFEEDFYRYSADGTLNRTPKVRQKTSNFWGAIFYHLSSPSRYLTKNILSLVIQIRKLFYFGLKFSVKSVYKSNTLC